MRRRSQQSGFTLIEILISLVIAAIAMIGVLGLYRAQTNASSFSRRNTEATMIAERQLETLRTQAAVVATITFPAVQVDETGTASAAGPFTVNTTVTKITVGTAPNLIGYDEIKVKVSWTEDGGTRTVTALGRRTEK